MNRQEEDGGNGIGTLKETSLHAALKEHYARAGDRLEVPVEGYLIDIDRGTELIEIQTGNFSALKPKLEILLDDYQLRIVHPIARERWIRRLSLDGEVLARRKSPKRGRVEEIFNELVYIHRFLRHPNLTLEVIMVQEEVSWRDDGRGSWRRKGWSVYDRRLLSVIDSIAFNTPEEFVALLPKDLEDPFTNRDLATAAGLRMRLAQKMTYCLRSSGLLEQVGNRGRSYLYRLPAR